MAAPSDNLRGIAAMTASMAVFFVNDICSKLAAAYLPLGEIFFMRGFFATIACLVLVMWAGSIRDLRYTLDWRIALRIVLEMGATVTYVVGFIAMPVAEATSIYQVTPLATTAAAALLYKEQVGWRRWTAIITGFIGVLIIVRPGSGNFNWGAVLMLVSVAFVLWRDMLTSRLPREIPTFAVSAVTAAAIMVMGPFLIPIEGHLSPHDTWIIPPPVTVLYMAIGGTFLALGYSLLTMAMRVGEISVVAPFRYSLLVWSFLAGYVLFGERPDAWTWIGAAIVVASGVYTFHRTRVKGGQAQDLVEAPPGT